MNTKHPAFPDFMDIDQMCEFLREEGESQAEESGEKPSDTLLWDAVKMLRALEEQRGQFKWNQGCPTKCYGSEWFIARLDNGDKVVLTALPEEFTYQYKTQDETYYSASRVKYWMQFPDSDFKPFNSKPLNQCENP